jgi:endogenous inhibitor of DNA gyrase (YacG/DUF329 family)
VPKCPVCQREARARAENSAFPFCGPRCKSIDLGNWLTERYRITVDEQGDDEDAEVSGDTDEGSHGGPDMRN